MVGSNLELSLGVKVWNTGEDSYGTTVTFSYPPGLSYRRVAVSQVLLLLGKPGTAGHQQRLVQTSGWAAIAQQPLTNPESGLILVGETRLCHPGLAHVVRNSGHPVLRTRTGRNECPAGC